MLLYGLISPSIIFIKTIQKFGKKMRHIIHILALVICITTLSIDATHQSKSKLPPFSCGSSSTPPTRPYPFCDAGLPVRERARDLISRLTLDEKISQLVNKAAAIPRLGIPYYQWWSEALHGVAVATGVENGVKFDGVVEAATSFPQVILTASTFDAHLWYRIAKGSAVGEGAGDPGEDPLLTAKYATSFVRGLQGDSFEGRTLKDGHLQVSACCKHFTAYDLDRWEGYDRFTFNAQVTKQDLADTYQPPFKGCIEEGKARMDVNCGSYLGNYTKSAVLKGTVSVSDIDRALENLFSVRMRLGLFNGPPSGTYAKLGRADVCSPEHQELALEVARQGIVLLKNEGNLLPLPKAEKGSLAVIGPNANVSKVLLGNYHGPPCMTITPLQGLMSYVEDVKFEQGCDTVNCSSVDVKRAVELAKSADHVVLVMGLNQEREKEDLDRDDLVLPAKQQSLIMSVAKVAKKPVVLVLLCGGPVDVSFAKNEPKIGSILWAGYPGQSGGRAIAEIIFGDYNPGGRLTMTWYPQDFIKIPMTDMRMRADPSSHYPGRTYRFYNGEKVFEFGYGLSYTTYSYKIVSVSQSKLDLKTSSSSASDLGYVAVQDLGSGSCDKARVSVIVSVRTKGRWRTDAKEKVSVEFSVSPCEHFSRANEDGEMVIESGDGSLVALHGVAMAAGVENGFSFNGTIRAATSFPQVILTSATFDPQLWYKIAKATGEEDRAIYNAGEATGMTMWSPNINIFRDPRWGRGQETPGEDPLVASRYAVAFVRGLQGDAFEGGRLSNDGRLLLSACCKHLIGREITVSPSMLK
ncbi:hypothetical protein SASPL_106468 [Salvia splendens]|uniref:Beta-D-xylosidase 4 n=1 Tax=Salvia splendens TaxID=180675 RepID=A0A8X8YMX3_SALSN|nr:hypothetical protein SASPL_106468 [Salvia splendens]